MYPFISGGGSPSGYQNPRLMSNNGQKRTSHISNPPPWSAGQPPQPPMAAQQSVRRASESAPSPQACYNCGGFNHWAQNCPEPRRAVPAGAMSNQRPHKRQKPNGPIVTQYPHPSKDSNLARHNQQSHFPQRGFTHPPLSHNFQPCSGPPAPMSAKTSPPAPWRQHSWPQSPLPRHPSQQWNSHGSPTPTTAPSSYLTSPASPARSGLQQNVLPWQTSIYQNSPGQLPPARHGLISTASPKHRQESLDQQRGSIFLREDAHNQYQNSEESNHNVQEEEEEDLWWQELQALDFPERSYDSLHVVSHPAIPVAEPLPSLLRDGDLAVRLPVAASLPLGTPVSKYFRDLDVEDFMRNFVDHCRGRPDTDDLALASFTDKSGTVSKEDLIKRRCKMAHTANSPTNGSEDFIDDDLQTLANASGARESEDSSGADGLPTPSQSHEAEEERQAREQEEKLAALGVTGFAKPVRASIRKSIVPLPSAVSEDREAQEAYDSSPNQTSNNALKEQRPNPFNDIDLKGYGGSGSPPGSLYNANILQTPPTSACHDSRSDSNEKVPRRTSSNGAQSNPTCSPDNAKYTQADAHYSTISEQPEGRRERRHLESPSTSKGADNRDDMYGSPLNDDSNRGLSRKRSIREFSPEVDEGPRRQKDECHQKDKRKVPKVAAAYSRRW